MDRREMLGTLGAAGLTAAGGLAYAQPQGGRPGGQSRQGGQSGLDPQKVQDIETMHECVRICNETVQHCLMQAKQDQQNLEDHLQNHEAVMDCQMVCTTTANLMARQSPFAAPVHRANAEVCAQCAEICENSQDKSEIVQRCAEICRKCEEMCRRYAQRGRGGGRQGGGGGGGGGGGRRRDD